MPNVDNIEVLQANCQFCDYFRRTTIKPAGDLFDILDHVSGKKKKKIERPVFDSIRKPVAPPGQKMGKDKPDEKANPTGRKAKHKKKDTEEN